MPVVAYLYFKTPAASDASTLFSSILASGISLTHFGKNDPPKRWSGDLGSISTVVLEQPEQNKWAFLRDSTQGVHMEVTLNYDPRWSWSSISLSATGEATINAICERLITAISPYLCIRGVSGAGKDQAWHILSKRADCPPDLIERVNGTYSSFKPDPLRGSA